MRHWAECIALLGFTRRGVDWFGLVLGEFGSVGVDCLVDCGWTFLEFVWVALDRIELTLIWGGLCPIGFVWGTWVACCGWRA